MFGVDLFELIIIAVVALIVFGPEKLPELSRQFGKMMAQFKRSSDALRREFYNELYPPADDIKRELQEAGRELRSVSADLRRTDLGRTDLEKAARRELERPPEAAPLQDKSAEKEK